MQRAAQTNTSPAPATQSPGASRERPAGDLQVAGRVRVQDSIEGLKRPDRRENRSQPASYSLTVPLLGSITAPLAPVIIGAALTLRGFGNAVPVV
jgi:hypothetical protein